MRFKSILLLLFLANALFGQGNCLIADLTATFISSNTATPCQYFVSLKFQHTATTNQFTVTGNGNNYGTFTYSQNPVLVGPFIAGNTSTIREFVVRDAIFQDCQDDVTIEIPACSAAACEISDLSVQTGVCNPDNGTYNLTLNFQVANPTNSKFDVWAGSGTYLGSYGLGQLPLTLTNFPWGGGVNDVIKVCIDDNLSCCKSISFAAPTCFVTNPCDISDLEINADSCTSDTTYRLKLNFHVAGTAVADSFALYGNGQFVGNYALSQLPITIPNFHWNGGAFDYLKVCLNTSIGAPPCCTTAEYPVPDCLNPCGINDLHVDVDSCTTDSTFRLTLNFNVNDPSAVDSFDLWGNGDYLGYFGLNQLPLSLDSFLWNGLVINQIRVCAGNTPACCKELAFLAPNCLPFGPCEVTDIFAVTGACTSDSTYKVRFFFNATNPGNGTYTAYAGNGTTIGTYPLSQIPLQIDNFPWSGNMMDAIKICINPDTPNTTLCCRSKEFNVPDCLNSGPCEIFDLTVDPGDCNPFAPTYSLVLNFQVQNPGNQFFEVRANNGVFLGTFPLSQLPLTIPNFPWSGGQVDRIKICINDHPDCCKTLEFQAPCIPVNCSIQNLEVITGICTGDSTYVVKVNFSVTNPPSNNFTLWANGVQFGNYNLSQLPLVIQNFPWNGGANDFIKVCFETPPGVAPCCETIEFPVPDCLNSGPCEIFDLTVDPGDCNPDASTYSLFVNFQVQNPPSNVFTVWANGVQFGNYNLNQLPLTIPNFPTNGGPTDVVKICFATAGAVTCCETKEFPAPDCLGNPCSINNLVIETGDCTSDSTYHVVINFQAINPLSNTFTVWANGVIFGTYNLNQLPLTIQNFPWNGGPNDVVKVCFLNAAGAPDCCATKEFAVPGCLDPNDPCAISNLTVEIGDCTSDSTYKLFLNFTVTNPPSNTFGVWANNVFLGLYNINQLPLGIPNFPWDGGTNDFVKLCFGNGGIITCCAIREFPVPTCLTQNGNCEINNLKVETGDCTSNTTYQLGLTFQVSNPPSNVFEVWANGVLFGTYNLSQLPLLIPNFPSDGGANDVIKVCIVPNAPNTPACCAVKEFPVPDCIGNNLCKIWDLHVVHTPCLCGQFFALLSFNYQNVGTGGFDVKVNGNPVGNFAYNTPQPIILGPFNGDGTTVYNFVVTDHQHADCQDEFEMGKVECMSPVVAPNNDAKLTLSPNPAADWISINVQMKGAAKAGQTKVDIFHADGRLVQTQVVGDGSNFQLDISGLPAGMYRIVLQTEAGRLEGTFAKQ